MPPHGVPNVITQSTVMKITMYNSDSQPFWATVIFFNKKSQTIKTSSPKEQKDRHLLPSSGSI